MAFGELEEYRERFLEVLKQEHSAIRLTYPSGGISRDSVQSGHEGSEHEGSGVDAAERHVDPAIENEWSMIREKIDQVERFVVNRIEKVKESGFTSSEGLKIKSQIQSLVYAWCRRGNWSIALGVALRLYEMTAHMGDVMSASTERKTETSVDAQAVTESSLDVGLLRSLILGQVALVFSMIETAPSLSADAKKAYFDGFSRLSKGKPEYERLQNIVFEQKIDHHSGVEHTQEPPKELPISHVYARYREYCRANGELQRAVYVLTTYFKSVGLYDTAFEWDHNELFVWEKLLNGLLVNLNVTNTDEMRQSYPDTMERFSFFVNHNKSIRVMIAHMDHYPEVVQNYFSQLFQEKMGILPTHVPFDGVQREAKSLESDPLGWKENQLREQFELSRCIRQIQDHLSKRNPSLQKESLTQLQLEHMALSSLVRSMQWLLSQDRRGVLDFAKIFQDEPKHMAVSYGYSVPLWMMSIESCLTSLMSLYSVYGLSMVYDLFYLEEIGAFGMKNEDQARAQNSLATGYRRLLERVLVEFPKDVEERDRLYQACWGHRPMIHALVEYDGWAVGHPQVTAKWDGLECFKVIMGDLAQRAAQSPSRRNSPIWMMQDQEGNLFLHHICRLGLKEWWCYLMASPLAKPGFIGSEGQKSLLLTLLEFKNTAGKTPIDDARASGMWDMIQADLIKISASPAESKGSDDEDSGDDVSQRSEGPVDMNSGASPSRSERSSVPSMQERLRQIAQQPEKAKRTEMIQVLLHQCAQGSALQETETRISQWIGCFSIYLFGAFSMNDPKRNQPLSSFFSDVTLDEWVNRFQAHQFRLIDWGVDSHAMDVEDISAQEDSEVGSEENSSDSVVLVEEASDDAQDDDSVVDVSEGEESDHEPSDQPTEEDDSDSGDFVVQVSDDEDSQGEAEGSKVKRFRHADMSDMERESYRSDDRESVSKRKRSESGSSSSDESSSDSESADAAHPAQRQRRGSFQESRSDASVSSPLPPRSSFLSSLSTAMHPLPPVRPLPSVPSAPALATIIPSTAVPNPVLPISMPPASSRVPPILPLSSIATSSGPMLYTLVPVARQPASRRRPARPRRPRMPRRSQRGAVGTSKSRSGATTSSVPLPAFFFNRVQSSVHTILDKEIERLCPGAFRPQIAGHLAVSTSVSLDSSSIKKRIEMQCKLNKMQDVIHALKHLYHNDQSEALSAPQYIETTLRWVATCGQFLPDTTDTEQRQTFLDRLIFAAKVSNTHLYLEELFFLTYRHELCTHLSDEGDQVDVLARELFLKYEQILAVNQEGDTFVPSRLTDWISHQKCIISVLRALLLGESMPATRHLSQALIDESLTWLCSLGGISMDSQDAGLILDRIEFWLYLAERFADFEAKGGILKTPFGTFERPCSHPRAEGSASSIPSSGVSNAFEVELIRQSEEKTSLWTEWKAQSTAVSSGTVISSEMAASPVAAASSGGSQGAEAQCAPRSTLPTQGLHAARSNGVELSGVTQDA